MRYLIAVIGLAVALYGADAAQTLQKGIDLMESKGDVAGAITLFQDAARSTDRAVAARALLYLARAQERQGKDSARQTYERIVREFSDQRDTAAQARERLASLSSPVNSKPELTARRLWTGEGIDDRLSLARDGRSIAVVDSSFDLALRDLDTGKITRLGFKQPGASAGGRWPVLSPDQQQIAFEWWGEDHTLRVASAQPGSSARVLVRNPETLRSVPSAWSIDGKAILTAMGKRDNTWQLAWVSVADGSVRTLKSLDWRSPENVTLSPDGKFIAYDVLERPNGLDRDIFILAADASSESSAVSGRGNDRAPVWAPDGKHLIFASNRSGSAGLYSIAIGGGKPQGSPTLLKPDVGRIYPRGFAPNGALYYVQAVGDSNIYKAQLDLATGKVRGEARPVANTWVGRNYSPSLSPDGKRVAYLSGRNPVRYGPGEPTVVVKSLDSDAESEFSTGLPIVGNPVWYAGGRRLMIASLDPKLGFDLHSIDVESGKVSAVRHLEPGFFPVGFALSPDGDMMYTPVAPLGSSSGSISSVNLSTMERKTLLALSGNDGGTMTLSPDRKTLALLASVRSGSTVTSKITLATTDGTGGTRVFEGRDLSDLVALYGIAWSPDGKYVYFARGKVGGECELWRMPVSGGQLEPTGVRASMLRGMDIGPNGELTFAGGIPERFELWTLDNLQPILKAAR